MVKGQKRVTARPGAKKAAPAREGSKKAEVLELMRRSKDLIRETLDSAGMKAATSRRQKCERKQSRQAKFTIPLGRPGRMLSCPYFRSYRPMYRASPST